MIILIAESKTMTTCNDVVAVSAENKPLLDEKANELMYSLRGMSAEQLSAAVKISQPMARRLHEMIYEYEDKRHGSKAIEAFTGVVFKAFNYKSLDDIERDFTNKNVRIISSLYGYLRPDDIVKAYRFDFTTKLAPGNESISVYWRDDVTKLLINDIERSGDNEILNLLPGDAEKELDMKLLSTKAKVVKAEFVEIGDGIARRTPSANCLKTLRGELLRQIVTQQIEHLTDLCSLEGSNYISGDSITNKNTIIFTTA
ncbi:MAG: YaaA family protein [Muribaculaceae bacterium]|nr:YaaA family protein [Muribaculaceae bacterium]MDE6353271.1 YaaA family protein [Muribaculaceae bacterium]